MEVFFRLVENFDHETSPRPFLVIVRVNLMNIMDPSDQGFSVIDINVSLKILTKDGVEDAFDFDDDNDGYTDVQELLWFRSSRSEFNPLLQPTTHLLNLIKFHTLAGKLTSGNDGWAVHVRSRCERHLNFPINI